MALVPGQLVDVTWRCRKFRRHPGAARSGQYRPDGQFVYAVKDGTAVQTPVKVLFDDGVHDAVSGNLKKGDHVITEGQLRVIPGAKVNITGAKRPAGAPAKGDLTSGRRRVPHAQDREG
jgi:multidrug efflux system membrane fusion protein